MEQSLTELWSMDASVFLNLPVKTAPVRWKIRAEPWDSSGEIKAIRKKSLKKFLQIEKIMVKNWKSQADPKYIWKRKGKKNTQRHEQKL